LFKIHVELFIFHIFKFLIFYIYYFISLESILIKIILVQKLFIKSF
jgi:hypothetical protein